MNVSFRSVWVFGDTCKSAEGGMSVSRFFCFKEAGPDSRHENEEAMKEKNLKKSICLPKSYIFGGGSGEKSASVSEGIAMSNSRNPAKVLRNSGLKQQCSFAPLYSVDTLFVFENIGREQVSSKSICFGKILGGSQPSVGYVPLSSRHEASVTHAFFRVCACGWKTNIGEITTLK